jgi:maleate isomerase
MPTPIDANSPDPTSYEPIVPRARIGFIIPSSNRMVEPQMQRYMPAGVVPHFSRIGMTNRHKVPLDQLLPRITGAADLLADSKCDVTVLQCTGTSMSGGVDMDKHVVAEIEKVTRRPALSTASALNDAFAVLGARRLVFISETKQKDHDAKVGYLREAGYDLIADKAASLAGTDAYCVTPAAFWFDLATSMRNHDADAYFLSCANITAIDVIEELERALGKPVVTSNQAALWCALRKAGIGDTVAGLGTLMQHAGPTRSAAAA